MSNVVSSNTQYKVSTLLLPKERIYGSTSAQVGCDGQDIRPLHIAIVPTVAAEQEVILLLTTLYSSWWCQLTAARMNGTQALRDTQDQPVDWLEGMTLLVQDWYVRMAPSNF